MWSMILGTKSHPNYQKRQVHIEKAVAQYLVFIPVVFLDFNLTTIKIILNLIIDCSAGKVDLYPKIPQYAGLIKLYNTIAFAYNE